VALMGEFGYSTNGLRYYFIRGSIGKIRSTPDYFQNHLGGINLTFADGHVKWISQVSIAAQTGPTGYPKSCNLSSPNEDYTFCSPLWNPFLA